MGQNMNLFFTIFTAIIIFLMIYNYKAFALCKVSTWGLALIVSGAIGNLIDRIVYSGVRDFIDTHWYEHHWPIFNVADSCITIGVALLLFTGWKNPENKPKETA